MESGSCQQFQLVQNPVQFQQEFFGYVQYGPNHPLMPVVATITGTTTTATEGSSSSAQVINSFSFYHLYPQAVPGTSTGEQQQQPVFLSGEMESEGSQSSQPKPCSSRRSKRKKASVSEDPEALSTADGTDESLVLPKPKAQGTYTLTGEKIRRPPNAFMIFAKNRRRELLYSNRELTNKDVSKMLGQEWKNLPEDERNNYKVASNEIRREHQAKYPGYCYNPMEARRAKKERKLKHEQKKKQSDTLGSISYSDFNDSQQVLTPTWPSVLSQPNVPPNSATVTEDSDDTGFNYDDFKLDGDIFLS